MHHHYMTGLIYEATGELNDAYVSYRNALDAYETYKKAFGLKAPAALRKDLARRASLGYTEDPAKGPPPQTGAHPPAAN